MWNLPARNRFVLFLVVDLVPGSCAIPLMTRDCLDPLLFPGNGFFTHQSSPPVADCSPFTVYFFFFRRAFFLRSFLSRSITCCVLLGFLFMKPLSLYCFAFPDHFGSFFSPHDDRFEYGGGGGYCFSPSSPPLFLITAPFSFAAMGVGVSFQDPFPLRGTSHSCFFFFLLPT